jgi:hypothetical protein
MIKASKSSLKFSHKNKLDQAIKTYAKDNNQPRMEYFH